MPGVCLALSNYCVHISWIVSLALKFYGRVSGEGALTLTPKTLAAKRPADRHPPCPSTSIDQSGLLDFVPSRRRPKRYVPIHANFNVTRQFDLNLSRVPTNITNPAGGPPDSSTSPSIFLFIVTVKKARGLHTYSRLLPLTHTSAHQLANTRRAVHNPSFTKKEPAVCKHTMAEAAEDPEDFVESPVTSDSHGLHEKSSKPQGKKRNAFAELMAPKPKAAKPDASSSRSPAGARSSSNKEIKKARSKWSGALLDYIDHPDRFPQQVIRVTDNTVLIRDGFPKATIHLLLLPRSPAHYDLHPHEAFEDKQFLAMMRHEAATAARLAAAELERKLSTSSASSKARNEAMEKGVPFDQLPDGRDYLSDIRIGVHAHPSMNHLHVHIISRDMHSDKVKHRKHYNSFNTPFFIPLDDYPLDKDDERRSTSFQNANLSKGFVCWRCGQEFGNKFAELKRHLETEFEQWKKE